MFVILTKGMVRREERVLANIVVSVADDIQAKLSSLCLTGKA